jgi:hypothetical protein
VTATAELGHLQPSRAVPSDDSLSPDSCRARRMLLMAESNHKRSFTHRNKGTMGYLSATAFFQAAAET